MSKLGTHRLMTVKGARPPASVMWRGHDIEQELRRLRVQYQSDPGDDDLKQRIAALEAELQDARGAR
jgi:hypothetical protein